MMNLIIIIIIFSVNKNWLEEDMCMVLLLERNSVIILTS